MQTELRILEIETNFDDEVLRTPLKFGTGVVRSITGLTVRARVENRAGQVADGVALAAGPGLSAGLATTASQTQSKGPLPGRAARLCCLVSCRSWFSCCLLAVRWLFLPRLPTRSRCTRPTQAEADHPQ